MVGHSKKDLMTIFISNPWKQAIFIIYWVIWSDFGCKITSLYSNVTEKNDYVGTISAICLGFGDVTRNKVANFLLWH